MVTTGPRTNFRHLLLIAGFAVIAMLPSYYNGLPSGNDQSQHYQFAWTIYHSIPTGEFYPALAGDTNHGFGDYGVRFYPPLTYYALSLAYAVLQDWYFASLLAFTFAFFAGGVGVYLWTSEELGAKYALVAAAIYIFAPYHLNQIYNNFLLAEFFAMAVIPFCFLFLTRVCRSGSWTNAAGLAVTYALLILTHLPLTILGSLAMGIYALMLLKRGGALQTIGKLAAAVLFSIIMTAFYWSRMLPELAWIKHSSSQYFSTTWDYRTNFLLVPDHFIKFGEDALNLWFADLLLVVTLLVTVPTVIYLLRDASARSRFLIALSTVFAAAVFMTTPLSTPLWDAAGFLQKVQFPWRWLSIVSLVGSAFASVGIVRMSEAMKTGRNILVPIGLGMVLVVFVFMAAFITKGSVYIPRSELAKQVAAIPQSEGCECWWPTGAQRSAFSQTEKVVAGTRTANVTTWSATEKDLHIDAGPAVEAAIATFYYPRWRATMNGAETPVLMNDDGAIALAIPPEAVDIKLTFTEPAYIYAATVISLAAWLIVLVFARFLLLKSPRDA